MNSFKHKSFQQPIFFLKKFKMQFEGSRVKKFLKIGLVKKIQSTAKQFE
jgi:hypothetical protein